MVIDGAMKLKFGLGDAEDPAVGGGKLDIEDRSNYDLKLKHSANVEAGAEYERTPRALSSVGSFILNITNHALGDLFDYVTDRVPEVYVHGQDISLDEPRREARFRVGNAVFHDGYKRDKMSPSVTLIGVGAGEKFDEASKTLKVGKDANAPGVPKTSDALDPVTDEHSGIIVLRSETEVRVDESNIFRVGDPFGGDTIGGAGESRMLNPGSVVTNGTDQSVLGDSPARSLYLKNALAVEVGRTDAALQTGGRASRLEHVAKYPAEDFTDGRPTLIIRDIVLDSAAVPKRTSVGLLLDNEVDRYRTVGSEAGDTSIYAPRPEGVVRLGVAVANVLDEKPEELGHYIEKTNTYLATDEFESKELYLTSNNYIDVDGRSRMKVGGMFFDGFGAQVEDHINAFASESDYTVAADYTEDRVGKGLGDVKNTLRGDSELHLNAGHHGGAMTMRGGSSRSDAVAGGDVGIYSGGTGTFTSQVWSGNSGNVVMASSDGGTGTDGGASGTIQIFSGNATIGVTGKIAISTGQSDALLMPTGDIKITTGDALEDASGAITIAVGLGGLMDGGDMAISAGHTTGVDRYGGDVTVNAGDGLSEVGLRV